MQKMESQLANLAAWFQTAVNKNDKPGQTAAGLDQSTNIVWADQSTNLVCQK